MLFKTIVPAIGIVVVVLIACAFITSATFSFALTPVEPIATIQTVAEIAATEVEETVSASPTPAPGQAPRPSVPLPSATLSRPGATLPPATVSRPQALPTAGALAVAMNTESINGIPVDRIVVMTDAARAQVRAIFARGQALGRNPRAFSKIGDSTMVYPPFLTAFGSRGYKLGRFAYLQTAIDAYAPSLARTSAAAKKGMHTWSEFDPEWVALNSCKASEGPLACELRLNNPSIAIIRLGANDYYAPKSFDEQLRKIVETCLAGGVIPILGTKPDRMEGPANTLNGMIAAIAAAYAVPLWDYDLVVATVPGKGLEEDGVHIRSGGSHDYTSSQAFASGDSLQDLSALMILDAVRRQVVR